MNGFVSASARERPPSVIGGRTFAEGDFLSLDGNDGSIFPDVWRR